MGFSIHRLRWRQRVYFQHTLCALCFASVPPKTSTSISILSNVAQEPWGKQHYATQAQQQHDDAANLRALYAQLVSIFLIIGVE